jgi:hypothetical protein
MLEGGNGLFPDDVPRDPEFFALSEELRGHLFIAADEQERGVGRSSADDPGILALIWLVLLITILVVNQLLNPR